MVRNREDPNLDAKKMVKAGLGIGAILLVVLAVLTIALGSWYTVPEGSVGVLFDQRTGFEYNEKPQGWGLKVPIIQRMIDIPFRTQTVGFYGGTEEADRGQYGAVTPKDKNGISFNIDVTVRYHLDPLQAAEFVEQKGEGTAAMESVLVTAVRSEALRGILGQENQEDIPSKLSELSASTIVALQDRINKEAVGKLRSNFIVVESVDLRNIDYNDAIEAKINEKQQAKQDAERQEYELQKAVTVKEIELTNADRDKQAAILRADGEAQSIRLVAYAKADGITKVNEAYQNMPQAYVYTKFAEAIQPTDKVYLGIESLGGNQLNFLDMNQLIAANKAKEQSVSG